MPILAYTVHVHDEDEVVHVFERGTEPPEWAVRLISNPIAWESGADSPAPDSPDEDEDAADSPDEDEDAAGSDDAIPARTGTDGTRAKWAAYAEAHGVTVRESWKREAIIAACERAGVRVD